MQWMTNQHARSLGTTKTGLSDERIAQNNKCFTVGPKMNQLFLLTAKPIIVT